MAKPPGKLPLTLKKCGQEQRCNPRATNKGRPGGRHIRHGRWGGVVGLNYFFTREVGIGADINMADNGGHFVDPVAGSVIFRWPFERIGLAPYVFGGGCRGTDPVYEWLGHAGAGLEWRFSPTTGVFVDGRYVWADKPSDNSLIRAGLRFAF
jgi:hypothetical protein